MANLFPVDVALWGIFGVLITIGLILERIARALEALKIEKYGGSK